MLNLIERGAVQAIKPETLDALALLYGLSYADLTTRWLCARYTLHLDEVVATHAFVRGVDAHSITLQGPGGSVADRVQIISLDYLRDLQAALPRGSEVGVAAVRFLDDSSYYEMVINNFLRGIRYSYYLPEEQHATYRAFVTRAERENPRLRGKLDGGLCRYISRVDLDAPANYVIFALPSGEIQAYCGLLFNDMVQYFLVADSKLSWRLFDGYCWSLRLARDGPARKRLSEISCDLLARRSQDSRPLPAGRGQDKGSVFDR